MTQREEPRRKDVHLQAAKALDQYVGIIAGFADIPQLASIYEQLPDAIKQGRSLVQMAADDMMDSFAFLMKDVPAEDLPRDYYKKLMIIRNADAAKTPSNADALFMLQDRIEKVRANFEKTQEVHALPDFINYTMDKAPANITGNLVRNWQATLFQMRRLLQTENTLSVQENAELLSGGFQELYQARQNEKAKLSSQIDQISSELRANSNDNGKDKPKSTALVATGGKGGPTPVPLSQKLKTMLGAVGEDLVELARKEALTDVDGREKEARSVFRVLMHKDNTAALIHGAEGVGKSAVVNTMAGMIANGTAPTRMKDAHIFKISLTNMMFSGTMEMMKPLLKEVGEHNRKSPNKIILHFSDYAFCPDPNIPLRQGIGMMRNLIVHEAQNNKGLLLCGEATNQDLFVLEKQDATSLKNFQRVKVESLSVPETKALINKQAAEYKTLSNVTISNDIIDYIIQKTDRFMPNQHFPGKAQRVLEDAVSFCESNGETALTEESIDNVIADATKLPLAFIGSSMSDSIDNLESNLLTQIFGQDKAVKLVASTVRLVNQNLNDPKKPIGVFYGIGPTGVGKTELAKALARSLFKDEKALITVNLSDFAEKHTVARIIGSPPGYVGYGEKTALEDVNERPFSVVLFDEAEKAHGDVDNALMKVMDEGQLTLLNGKELNFRNCVLIFSSNLGASAAEEARERRRPGFSVGTGESNDNNNEAKTAIEEAKKARLKPEFRNRATFIDFDYLTEDVASLIADKKIRDVSERLRENKLYKNLTVTLAPDAKAELMKLGYSKPFGARPMERAISQNVLIPLGQWLSDQQKSGATANWLSGQFEVVVKNLAKFEVEVKPANKPAPPAAPVPAVA